MTLPSQEVRSDFTRLVQIPDYLEGIHAKLSGSRTILGKPLSSRVSLWVPSGAAIFGRGIPWRHLGTRHLRAYCPKNSQGVSIGHCR
jgi:hypothetical protein